MQNTPIGNSWDNLLDKEFESNYMKTLKSFIEQQRIMHNIYPSKEEVFNAFKLTPFEDVKVVILGQDPYHRANQAHGLSFSVNHNIKTPPSLINIYKELNTDIGMKIPNHGNLTTWANQGVLLLNSTLTVRCGEPGSHQNKGWEKFTDATIKLISEKKENCVFLLWGKFAVSKQTLIDAEKHLVLTAAHPSPLARGAFFGCKHFSKTNEYFKNKKIKEIDWLISEI